VLQKLEEVRGGPGGEKRARPTRLDRRHVARLQARGGVPNSENTTMNGDQEAAGDPRLDLRLCDTGAQQLIARYDAVRAGGNPSDFFLDGGDLWSPHDH
jgi:hypothetical protein